MKPPNLKNNKQFVTDWTVLCLVQNTIANLEPVTTLTEVEHKLLIMQELRNFYSSIERALTL